MIGTYQPKGAVDSRPFKWDNGVVSDLGVGSKFAQKFESIGVYPLKIQVETINNRGELAGFVDCGKFNLLTGKYTLVKREVFFGDGELHLVEFPLSSYTYKIKLNNVSELLCVTGDYMSYLWNLGTGLKSVDGLHGIDFNDRQIVLGYLRLDNGDSVPGLWINNKIMTLAQLLNVEDIHHLAQPYSPSFEPESIDSVVGINNKGQIAGECSVWGDRYPCILNLSEGSR